MDSSIACKGILEELLAGWKKCFWPAGKELPSSTKLESMWCYDCLLQVEFVLQRICLTSQNIACYGTCWLPNAPQRFGDLATRDSKITAMKVPNCEKLAELPARPSQFPSRSLYLALWSGCLDLRWKPHASEAWTFMPIEIQLSGLPAKWIYMPVFVNQDFLPLA